MIGGGSCFWKPDVFKINGKLRFSTSCGEHWFASEGRGVPFNICPFCNKTIWFQADDAEVKEC